MSRTCPVKLWLSARYGSALGSSPHPALPPLCAEEGVGSSGSSGSAPSIGLSSSLCADSHAWTRSCCTIPKRYGRNINCQNLGIRGPDKHYIYHSSLSLFLCIFLKFHLVFAGHNRANECRYLTPGCYSGLLGESEASLVLFQLQLLVWFKATSQSGSEKLLTPHSYYNYLKVTWSNERGWWLNRNSYKIYNNMYTRHYYKLMSLSGKTHKLKLSYRAKTERKSSLK